MAPPSPLLAHPAPSFVAPISRLAVAGQGEPPDDPPPPSGRSTGSTFDPLWEAAFAADNRGRRPDEAAALWVDLVAGRAKIYCERVARTRSHAVARTGGGSSGVRCPLNPAEATVLLRVLCGEQQKLVSSELGIAHSTASKRCAQALEKLDLHHRPLPLPLIVAAQHAAGVGGAWTRHSTFDYQGCSFTVTSVPRPTVKAGSGLTLSEQGIACLLVEGHSRFEIARSRSTSAQTVSCQLRAIFSKFRVNGRHGLVRRAAELGWFED
jgi:DNA-binding CsgD family transcriptional regulator